MRTHPPVQRHRTRRLVSGQAVLIALAAVVAVLVTTAVTRPPETVERLALRNDTPWHLTASVSPTPDGPRTPLPVLLAGRTTEVDDVLDQGGTWFVHLRAGGVTIDPIEVQRSTLDDDWTFVVPESVAGALRSAGAGGSTG